MDIRKLLEHIDTVSQEPVDEWTEHSQQVPAIEISAGNTTMYFEADALFDALVEFVENAVRQADPSPHTAPDYKNLIRAARNADPAAGDSISISMRMVDSDFFDEEDDEDFV